LIATDNNIPARWRYVKLCVCGDVKPCSLSLEICL